MNDNLTTKLVSQREATNESWNRFNHERSRPWGLYGHDMGIHDFNLMLGGWVPKKVTTVGGRSGHGKTALLVPILEAAGRVTNGKRAEILFFSWEISPSFIVDRFICNKLGITLRMLNQGSKLLDEEAVEAIRKVEDEASKLPIHYQLISTDIDTVRAISYEFIQQCKEKEEIEGVSIQPVIIIDYLGMAQFVKEGLRTYGIGDFMNGFKQLCNFTGASGLIFTQISRTADDKIVPDRTDFADSQAIEMASDNMLLIHRPEYLGRQFVVDPLTGKETPSENKLLVRVLKGRDYGTGDFLINCDIKYFRFHSLNHEWNYPYYELYTDPKFWINHFGLNKITNLSLFKQPA